MMSVVRGIICSASKYGTVLVLQIIGFKILVASISVGLQNLGKEDVLFNLTNWCYEYRT